MPSGKRGSTKAQEEAILGFIREEILLGRTFDEVLPKVRRKAPLVTAATAKQWINAVIEAIAITRKQAREGQDFRLGLADQRLHELFRKADAAGDLKLALQIHAHWIKLHGLEAKKAPKAPINVLLQNMGKASVITNQDASIGMIEEEDDEQVNLAAPRLCKEDLLKIADLPVQEAEIVQKGEPDNDVSGMDREGSGPDGHGDDAGEDLPEEGEGFGELDDH